MIVGTGIDIVEVDRIREKISRNSGFVSLVFSEKEREYCEKQPRPFEHFAARFAAKEAFLKAVGTGISAGFDLCNIEVVVLASGKPCLQLNDHFNILGKERGLRSIHLSLSHTTSYACAVIIIES
ncbi:MAG: holo-ACP synthase [Crocinitomicaceae bacterium]|nr:holo-ACP synthase [Crocinitomicaceae bacterium]